MIRRVLVTLGICAGLGATDMWKHDYAEVNGVKLHYVTAGKGKLILFLHGFPEFWYQWRKQLPEFARDHQAVAPDLRGYNLSSKPAEVEAYRIPALVEDVRALIRHLGHETCILVGHDWGGVVAWVFAATHPDMVEKLVILNAPHPGVFQRELRENPAQQKASQYMLFFRSEGAEAGLAADNYAALVKNVLGETVSGEDRRAYLEAWAQPGALTGGLNYYRASQVGPPAANDQVRPAPPAPPLVVKPPTLVIWGERDTALLLGNLDGLEPLVEKLTVRRIPDATHWVVHEKPDLVNRYIREFLK